MNILQWCKIDEYLLIAENDEIYKRYAGLEYSKEAILSLAKLRLQNSKLYLKHYKEPNDLFVSVIENFVQSSTKNLELKLYDIRSKKIVSSQTFNNKRINWNTWRQFNHIEKDSSKRKKVFDEFIEKTKYISPVIYNRFEKIRSLYLALSHQQNNNKYIDNYNQLNPLSGYLINEKITYAKFIDFIKHIGNKARNPFKRSFQVVGQEILNRNPEYYDDFYFFRNKIYKDFDNTFKKINPVKEIQRILKILGFDLKRINFDVKNRENKYPSPICFFVQIPYDIRILYKSESPYFDLQGCFHESGHAMHASSINHEIEYWKKYYISMGIAEIFSILLERITKNKNFLKSIVEIDDYGLLDRLILRTNFMELFFVTFYSANSLLKTSFWKDHLSIDDSNLLYSKLVKDFTGIEIPGEYWMLHHILPDAIMYVPSYLFAAVRAKELDVHLQNIFGETWWMNKDAGKYLQQIMSPGADIDLSLFSKLDSDLYLKEIISK
ncbi:MAG: hypothetical protein AB7F53_03750 [Nitrososphaeraceae archaeon]